MRALTLTVLTLLPALACSAAEKLDVLHNETPIHAPANPQAIGKIPANYRFIEPGTLTVEGVRLRYRSGWRTGDQVTGATAVLRVGGG